MEIIHVTGRLTADANLRSTIRQGVKSEFMSFTVAATQQSGDEKMTNYYDCTMRKTGVLEYLRKGTQVCVYGNLRIIVKEEPETGKTRVHLNISVTGLELVGTKPKGETDTGEG